MNIRQWSKRLSLILCISAMLVAGSVWTLGASDIPKAQLPAAITSLGQSPDAYTLNVLAKRAKIKIDYNSLLPVKDVPHYKTLFMTVGASLKGFGSAGVNLDTEIKRGQEIIKTANENDVFLVIAHTGGEGRREQMSDKLLDKVAGKADYLIVLEDGNKDGYFTDVASENKIPLKLIGNIFEIQTVLKEMFSAQ